MLSKLFTKLAHVVEPPRHLEGDTIQDHAAFIAWALAVYVGSKERHPVYATEGLYTKKDAKRVLLHIPSIVIADVVHEVFVLGYNATVMYNALVDSKK